MSQTTATEVVPERGDNREGLSPPCREYGCTVVERQYGFYFDDDDDAFGFVDVIENRCIRHALRCGEFRAQETGHHVCSETVSIAECTRRGYLEQVDGYSQWYCEAHAHRMYG